ncbi:MAG: GyrI-like domain-containing protein [Nitrospinae bacterium]|nr:GyrI-like domain-containing protein [Nitrospinota bacterium]
MPNHSVCEIVEKVVSPLTVVSVRWKGPYKKTGEVCKNLGRIVTKHVSGPAMNLHYDLELKQDDADVETCIPVSARFKHEGANIRTLSGGKCLSLIHEGPYEELDEAYKIVMKHVEHNNLKVLLPTREIFIKGPGMVFKGNPKHYLTELQFFLG